MVMRGSATCASRKKGDHIRLSYTFHYPGIVNRRECRAHLTHLAI